MKFPIVLKQSPEPEAPGRLYYEVASNGLFQVRDTPVYHAVTRVTSEVPGLLASRERLWMKFPRLPAGIVEDVLAFFSEVNDRWRAEAIAMLYYRPESRTYRVDAPPQRIPGYLDYAGQWRALLRLDYGNAARPEGFLHFGIGDLVPLLFSQLDLEPALNQPG